MADELLRFAGRGPAPLVFEDAQWADRATIDLLRLLVQAVAETPALLIVTSRLRGEPRLGPTPSLVQLALGRLDGAAAAALLAATAGRHPLPGRLTNDILARSDGVPLFIEEMTKAIIETTPAGGAVTVPATLRDSLVARLDASPTMKAVAQIASCIGRDFGEAMLFQIADFPQDELQEALTALLRVGLLLATFAGQFRFKHALVCDIAYESLLTPRRQKLHQRIAEAIEAMPGATAQNEPETLAHHWKLTKINACARKKRSNRPHGILLPSSSLCAIKWRQAAQAYILGTCSDYKPERRHPPGHLPVTVGSTPGPYAGSAAAPPRSQHQPARWHKGGQQIAPVGRACSLQRRAFSDIFERRCQSRPVHDGQTRSENTSSHPSVRSWANWGSSPAS
jgi:predicted ATPase